MILITGVAGFIGTNLAKILLEKGESIVGVDNFITGQRKNISFLSRNSNFSFVKGDIRESRIWKALEKKASNCKQIYHLACPTGVPNCKRYAVEMLTTSVFGTQKTLDFAKKAGAKVLFTSSSEIYGDPRYFPQKESYWGNVDPVGFRSPYEEGKRCAESVVMIYVGKHGVNATIARIFNTYGLHMSCFDSRVIPQFLHQVSLNKPMTIYGDGSQTRTFCYADDTVNALLLLMDRGKNGEVYNVGSDKEISIHDLAKLIKKIVRNSIKIVFLKNKFPDHKRRLPDISKIKKLGWKSKVSLDNGLRKAIDEFKKV